MNGGIGSGGSGGIGGKHEGHLSTDSSFTFLQWTEAAQRHCNFKKSSRVHHFYLITMASSLTAQ